MTEIVNHYLENPDQLLTDEKLWILRGKRSRSDGGAEGRKDVSHTPPPSLQATIRQIINRADALLPPPTDRTADDVMDVAEKLAAELELDFLHGEKLAAESVAVIITRQGRPLFATAKRPYGYTIQTCLLYTSPSPRD